MTISHRSPSGQTQRRRALLHTPSVQRELAAVCDLWQSHHGPHRALNHPAAGAALGGCWCRACCVSCLPGSPAAATACCSGQGLPLCPAAAGAAQVPLSALGWPLLSRGDICVHPQGTGCFGLDGSWVPGTPSPPPACLQPAVQVMLVMHMTLWCELGLIFSLSACTDVLWVS